MTPYTYGDAGNLVSQNQSGILIASYTYDSQNRMTAATAYGISGTLTETYNYDALGNRIAKTTDGVKTEYVIDYSTGYAQVLRATTDADTVFYTRGFELISRKDATRELWYLTDGGGSVRFLTDSTGSVTDSLVFDAFGNTVSRAGQTGDSYGFQGEQQDATGLYYLRARYMNPATSSFTQMDTYGGSLSDPISLHKYLFANANPVKYRDPSGHMAILLHQGTTISMMSILESAMTCSLISMGAYLVGTGSRVLFGKQAITINQFITGLAIAGIAGFCLGAIGFMATCMLSLFISTFAQAFVLAAVLLMMRSVANYAAANFYQDSNYFGASLMQVLADILLIIALSAIAVGIDPLPNSSETSNGSKTAANEETANANGGGGSTTEDVAEPTTKLVDGKTMNTDDALDAASDYLGEGYIDMGNGRYVSADGTRQVRFTDSDLTIINNHAGAPHINFETLVANPVKPGKMIPVQEQNIHIFLED